MLVFLRKKHQNSQKWADAVFLLTVGSFLLTVGVFLLTVDNFSFFTYNWSFFFFSPTVLAFLLTIEFLCLQWESVSNKRLKGL